LAERAQKIALEKEDSGIIREQFRKCLTLN
jgi:hypothetical protein